MIGKSNDSHRRITEDEISQFFQQFEPVEIPEETRYRVRTKLLDEVANTFSTPSSRSPQLEFPLVGWLQRSLQQVPNIRLGPGLAAAAMSAVATLLILLLYPSLYSSPTAQITVLPTLDSRYSELAVIAHQRQGKLVTIGALEKSMVEQGDSIFAHSSSILIEFVDGWKSTIQPGTVLEIEKYSRSNDEVDIVLALIEGEIITEINRELGYAGKMKVRTPSATAEAIGTKFVVRTDSDSSAYFAVLAGTIQISMPDGEDVAVQDGEQLITKEGEVKLFKDQTGGSLEPDPGSAFVTAAWSDVALYSGPSQSTSQLGSLSINDKMELVGSTADQTWYVVCCVFDEVFGWVDASQVNLHNVQNFIPRFAEDLILNRAELERLSSSQATSETLSSDEKNEDQSETNISESAEREQSQDEPTEQISPTSTPLKPLTPTPQLSGSPTAQPHLPDIEPALPAPETRSETDLNQQPTVSPAPTTGTTSEPDTVPTAAATALPTESISDGAGPTSDAAEVEPTSTAIVQPAPTQTSVDLIVITPTATSVPIEPTNTPVPTQPQPTNTRRPNTPRPKTPTPVSATSTPVPPTPVPTNTPVLPTDTPVVPTNTASSVPATPTPTAEAFTPTNTPMFTATATPEAFTATPAPTEPAPATPTEAVATSVPIPTLTPQMITPTDTPVPNATPTPDPKLTVITEPLEPTNTPEPTSTSAPPTATATPVPPTATQVPQIVIPTATAASTPAENAGQNQENRDHERDEGNDNNSNVPDSGE